MLSIKRRKFKHLILNFKNVLSKATSQGKVEAELILMTGEEAEKNPAGLGREDPNGQKLDADDYHDHDDDDDYDHDNEDDNDDEKNPGLITLCRNCKFEDTCELTNL